MTPSQEGETVTCGDDITRVLFPGIPIHSLDGEEAGCTCAARGQKADHPCPRCLVHKSELHKVLKDCPLRTVEAMHHACQQAKAAKTKSAVDQIMRKHGLHDVWVCYSCPSRGKNLHLTE
jgi:hypothetical protein